MEKSRYPGDAVIDKYMIMFKRWLKERGEYNFIMKYLFVTPNRSMEEFYQEVKRLYDGNRFEKYDFGDILHISYTLGPSYFNIGNRYWYINVNPISREWEIYFDEHKDVINNGK